MLAQPRTERDDEVCYEATSSPCSGLMESSSAEVSRCFTSPAGEPRADAPLKALALEAHALLHIIRKAVPRKLRCFPAQSFKIESETGASRFHSFRPFRRGGTPLYLCLTLGMGMLIMTRCAEQGSLEKRLEHEPGNSQTSSLNSRTATHHYSQTLLEVHFFCLCSILLCSSSLLASC